MSLAPAPATRRIAVTLALVAPALRLVRPEASARPAPIPEETTLARPDHDRVADDDGTDGAWA